MPSDETAPIMVRIYDGTRKLMPEGINLLYRLLDVNKKQQQAKHVEKPVLRADVPFFDNLGDRYTVIDTLAHLVLEVLVNQFGRNTDPRVIYVLRWIAGRRAGKPDFNPPHEIRA